MNRRSLLLSTASAATLGAFASGTAATAAPLTPTHPLQSVWRAWRAAHLQPDGRVVDGPQGGVSHSEGQGYGMTLAAHFGDEQAFGRMFDWTERNLAVRADGLLAWRWKPNAADPTPDRNNASDGDLFYAWALSRAAAAFEQPIYARRAEAIATALVDRCVKPSPTGAGLLMLPAAAGFETERSVIVNPSYYMPRAMREVAEATGAAALATCAADGEALIAELARSGLVPDWVEIDAAGWRSPDEKRGRSGYEAMRVPLFLAWSGSERHPAIGRALAAHRAADIRPQGFAGVGAPVKTATIFERKSFAVLERSGDLGYAAMIALADCAAGGADATFVPPYDSQQPYYPATLHAFSLLALEERHPLCVPV